MKRIVALAIGAMAFAEGQGSFYSSIASLDLKVTGGVPVVISSVTASMDGANSWSTPGHDYLEGPRVKTYYQDMHTHVVVTASTKGKVPPDFGNDQSTQGTAATITVRYSTVASSHLYFDGRFTAALRAEKEGPNSYALARAFFDGQYETPFPGLPVDVDKQVHFELDLPNTQGEVAEISSTWAVAANGYCWERPVPEPATLASIAIGLSLGAARRRRV